MSLTIAESPPPGLPPADTLITLIRQAFADGATPAEANTRLDTYQPVIDVLTDTRGAAEWLGISPQSISRERSRGRWPQPDNHASRGRRPLWSFRTLAWHRATMPGRGSAGRGRPASAKTPR